MTLILCGFQHAVNGVSGMGNWGIERVNPDIGKMRKCQVAAA
jgi:hypothetical protein